MAYSLYSPCCNFQFHYTFCIIQVFREFFQVIVISPWWVAGLSMAKIGSRLATSILPSSFVQLAFHPLLLEQLHHCDLVIKSSLAQTGITTGRSSWHLNRRGCMLHITIPFSPVIYSYTNILLRTPVCGSSLSYNGLQQFCPVYGPTYLFHSKNHAACIISHCCSDSPKMLHVCFFPACTLHFVIPRYVSILLKTCDCYWH
jgi:hypothetical protein